MAYNKGSGLLLNFGADTVAAKKAIKEFVEKEENQKLFKKIGLDTKDAMRSITSLRTEINKYTGDLERISVTFKGFNGITGASFAKGKNGFVSTSDMGTLEKTTNLLKNVTNASNNLTVAKKNLNKLYNDPVSANNITLLKKEEDRVASLIKSYNKLASEAQYAGIDSAERLVSKTDIGIERTDIGLMSETANKKLQAYNKLQSETLSYNKKIAESEAVVTKSSSANTKERQKYTATLKAIVAEQVKRLDVMAEDIVKDNQKRQSVIASTQSLLSEKQALLEETQAQKQNSNAILENLNVKRESRQASLNELIANLQSNNAKIKANVITGQSNVALETHNASLIKRIESEMNLLGVIDRRVQSESENNNIIQQSLININAETRGMEYRIALEQEQMAINDELSQQQKKSKEETLTKQKETLDAIKAQHSVNNSFFRDLANGWKEAAARIVNYTVVYRSLWAGIKLFKDAINTVKELNKAFTNIQMVTGYTTEQVRTLKETYADLAKEMGSTIDAVTAGAESWLRQGRSIEETNELLKQSTIFSKISGMDSAQATEYLTSTINGYRLMASEAENVIDVFNYLDVVAATSAEEIAEAFTHTANSAKDAGIEWQNLAAIITTVSEVTRKSSSSIGEGVKTLTSRYMNVKAGAATDEEGEDINNVEKTLRTLGIEIRDANNDFKDMYSVMGQIANAWDDISGVKRGQIATAMAGVRQAEIFRSIMNNWDKVKIHAEQAYDAAGYSAKKYEVYLDSIEAKTNTLVATFQELAYQESWETIYKAILDVGIGFGKFLNQLSEAKVIMYAFATTATLAIGAFGVKKVKNIIGHFAEISQGLSFVMRGENGLLLSSELLGKQFSMMSNEAMLAAISMNKLNSEEIIGIINAGGLITEEQKLILTQEASRLSTEAQAAAQGTLGVTTDALTYKLGKLKAATLSFLKSPVGALIALVSLGLLFNYLNETVFSLNAKIEKSTKNLEEFKGELEEVETALSDVVSQIEELEKISDLTLVEESKLNALNAQADILELQKKILEDKVLLEKEELKNLYLLKIAQSEIESGGNPITGADFNSKTQEDKIKEYGNIAKDYEDKIAKEAAKKNPNNATIEGYKTKRTDANQSAMELFEESTNWANAILSYEGSSQEDINTANEYLERIINAAIDAGLDVQIPSSVLFGNYKAGLNSLFDDIEFNELTDKTEESVANSINNAIASLSSGEINIDEYNKKIAEIYSSARGGRFLDGGATDEAQSLSADTLASFVNSFQYINKEWENGNTSIQDYMTSIDALDDAVLAYTIQAEGLTKDVNGNWVDAEGNINAYANKLESASNITGGLVPILNQVADSASDLGITIDDTGKYVADGLNLSAEQIQEQAGVIYSVFESLTEEEQKAVLEAMGTSYEDLNALLTGQTAITADTAQDLVDAFNEIVPFTAEHQTAIMTNTANTLNQIGILITDWIDTKVPGLGKIIAGLFKIDLTAAGAEDVLPAGERGNITIDDGTGGGNKDVLEDYNASKSYLEHLIKLSENAQTQMLPDSELYKKEYDKQLVYYKQILESSHAKAEELRADGYKKDSDEIMELQNIWWDAFSKKEEVTKKYYLDSIDYQEKLLNAELNIIEAQKSLYDEGSREWFEAQDDLLDVYKEQLKVTEDRIKTLQSLDEVKYAEDIASAEAERLSTVSKIKDVYEENADQLRSVVDVIGDLVDREVQKLEKEKEVLEGVKDLSIAKLDAQRNMNEATMGGNTDLASSYQSDINYIEKQLSLINKMKDDDEKRNAIAETNLELGRRKLAQLKAQKALIEGNKNIRLYDKDKGWQWVADETATLDAEQAILEQQFENKSLMIEDEITDLEDYAQAWEDSLRDIELKQAASTAKIVAGFNLHQAVISQDTSRIETWASAYKQNLEEIAAMLRQLDYLRNNAYRSQNTYSADSSGSAPAEAQVGDLIQTHGGTYQIVNKGDPGATDRDGNGVWSRLVDPTPVYHDGIDNGLVGGVDLDPSNEMMIKAAKGEGIFTPAQMGNVSNLLSLSLSALPQAKSNLNNNTTTSNDVYISNMNVTAENANDFLKQMKNLVVVKNS